MKVEIDVELPEDVLNEWEPVAFRSAKGGESFVMDNGELETLRQDDTWKYPRLILRRRFQWPAWLKCRYLVWDEDGTVSGWNAIPDLDNHEWTNEYDPSNKIELCASQEHAKHLGITFPGGDWRTRIEENPNWKDAT